MKALLSYASDIQNLGFLNSKVIEINTLQELLDMQIAEDSELIISLSQEYKGSNNQISEILDSEKSFLKVLIYDAKIEIEPLTDGEEINVDEIDI